MSSNAGFLHSKALVYESPYRRSRRNQFTINDIPEASRWYLLSELVNVPDIIGRASMVIVCGLRMLVVRNLTAQGNLIYMAPTAPIEIFETCQEIALKALRKDDVNLPVLLRSKPDSSTWVPIGPLFDKNGAEASFIYDVHPDDFSTIDCQIKMSFESRRSLGDDTASD